MPKLKLKLYYLHDERRIVDQEGEDVTYERARELWQDMKIDDYNLALHTLATHDWDSDKVDAHYKEQDKYR